MNIFFWDSDLKLQQRQSHLGKSVDRNKWLSLGIEQKLIFCKLLERWIENGKV